MIRTDFARFVAAVHTTGGASADPEYHGWRLAESLRGADPYLLTEWMREGADAGPVYQFDAGTQTAWAYHSPDHGGWVVADTVSDDPRVFTGPMNDITLQVAARLVGDDLTDRWLFDDEASAPAEAGYCYE